MAEIPEWLNQKVARTLHDQGVEMTPQQVVDARTEAYRKIRKAMRARGYDVPEGDLELLEWMKEIGVGPSQKCSRCNGPMVHDRLRGYHCFRECQQC